MDKFLSVVTTLLMYAVIILFVAIVIGWPVMALWNVLVPAIFGLKEITFWQAVGLCLLINLLAPTSAGSKN